MEPGRFPCLFKRFWSCKHLQLPAWSFSLSHQLWFVRKEKMRLSDVAHEGQNKYLVCIEILHNYMCFPGICLNQWRLLCFLGINLSDAFFLLLPHQVLTLNPGPDPELVQNQNRGSTQTYTMKRGERVEGIIRNAYCSVLSCDGGLFHHASRDRDISTPADFMYHSQWGTVQELACLSC